MNIFIATFIKNNSIYVDSNQKQNNDYPIPYRLAELLRKCGYVLKEELQGWISPKYENKILKNLGNYLLDTFGIDKTWKGVYTTPDNIPEEEKQRLKDQLEIYANPDYIKTTRDEGESKNWESNNYNESKFLGKAGKEDIVKSTSNLLSSILPLRAQDQIILDWGLENLELEYPEKIGCKEILCRVLFKGYGENCISSINDILRLVTYISYDDVTLIEKNRIKLNNRERKMILGYLENFLKKNPEKYIDSKKYYNKWIIVSQVLHTNKSKYPESYKFFSILHGKDKTWMHKTFKARLQQAYDKAGKNGSLKEVINILSTRGGEFLRRFDSVLRRTWENKDLAFSDLGCKLMSIQNIRPKTLLELYNHFNNRNIDIPRSFKDKRGVRHSYDSLKPLDKGLIVITQSLILGKLKNIYGEKKIENQEKVYVDIPGDLEFCLSLRSCIEGQTLPGYTERFEKTGILRFFSQWIDKEGDQDLDIHAWFVNEDLSEVDRVSWNKKFIDESEIIKHSGDVRHVKGNCAEYINIDFRETKEIPYRWMLIGVQNYDSEKLSDLENYIGLAKITGDNSKKLRWAPKKNEIIFRSKVMIESKNLIGFLVDFKDCTVKYILEGTEQNLCNFNPERVKQYALQNNIKLKKLLELYLKAKGYEIVEKPDEETKIYTVSDMEEISNMLLGD